MPRLGFSGFDHADEASARSVFEGLGLPGWSLADEATADAILIDLDSMYGQMAWMKGIDEGKVSIGLTRAARADTAYRLDAPLTGEALAAALRSIGAAFDPTPAPPSRPTPRDAPANTEPMSASRLAVRITAATTPFAVQLEGLPRVVIDPQRQQFAPGKSLKALLAYATAELPADAVKVLDAAAAEAALASAGDPQPLSRLTWLLALGGGDGRLGSHGAQTRFQLGKWPQVEREFPKHFRIATVMLKAPATVSEIALASGASEAEVADYVNAALAAGHASAV